MHTDPVVLFNRLLARGRLRHLQLLVALADAGSVQRAAAAIDMSQPAATQALSDLEGLLEATLFERHSRGVRMTRYGQAVVPVARSVMQALRASTETLSALQAGAQALLRLGCIPAAASGLLAAALPGLLKAHKGLQIELMEENTVHLLPELAAGRLDAVVCRKPRELPSGWTFELLLPDEPVVLAARDHPLARRRKIGLSDLALFPWILPPQGVAVRDFFDRLWAHQPVRPPVYPLATTALALVQEVMDTAGALSLVPGSIARALTDTGAAVRLKVAFPGALGSPLEGLGLITTGVAHPPALEALRARLAP